MKMGSAKRKRGLNNNNRSSACDKHYRAINTWKIIDGSGKRTFLLRLLCFPDKLNGKLIGSMIYKIINIVFHSLFFNLDCGKLIERKQLSLCCRLWLGFCTETLKVRQGPDEIKSKGVSHRYQLVAHLTANLPFRAKLFVGERKAGKFVLVNASDNVVGNGCQHWFLACKFRVEIDGITCASLK